MIKCPYCGVRIEAIESMGKDKFVGGCVNKKCPVIFRTKETYSKADAIEAIIDVIKFSKM